MKPPALGRTGWRHSRALFLLLTGLGFDSIGQAQTNLIPPIIFAGTEVFSLTGQTTLRSAYTFDITGWGAIDLNFMTLNFGQVVSSPELPPGLANSVTDSTPTNASAISMAALTNNIRITANTVGIACGEKHTVLLKRDGTVEAVGSLQSGQVAVPPNLTNVIAIAAGTDHNLALLANGRVVAWGWNDAHQIDVPTDLAAVHAVAAGRDYSLALLANGTVRAWGDSLDDSDEDWVYGADMEPPPELRNPILSRVVAIAAGARHALALRRDGSIVGWGKRDDQSAWLPPDGAGPFTAVSAGKGFSVGLRPDGTVRAWGDNRYHQLEIPPGLDHIVAIACGNYHTLALKNDGSVVAWGNNSAGQTDVPPDASRVVAIAAGGFHNEILEQSGPLMAHPRIENGLFDCEMNLTAGQRYRLQGSRDLRNWVTLEVGTALPPRMGWEDPARFTGAAFYRVQIVWPGEPDFALPPP